MLLVMIGMHSLLQLAKKRFKLLSCLNVFYALLYLSDIFIRFSTKIHSQTVGTPMDTNCAPLVADLIL